MNAHLQQWICSRSQKWCCSKIPTILRIRAGLLGPERAQRMCNHMQPQARLIHKLCVMLASNNWFFVFADLRPWKFYGTPQLCACRTSSLLLASTFKSKRCSCVSSSWPQWILLNKCICIYIYNSSLIAEWNPLIKPIMNAWNTQMHTSLTLVWVKASMDHPLFPVSHPQICKILTYAQHPREVNLFTAVKHHNRTSQLLVIHWKVMILHGRLLHRPFASSLVVWWWTPSLLQHVCLSEEQFALFDWPSKDRIKGPKALPWWPFWNWTNDRLE